VAGIGPEVYQHGVILIVGWVFYLDRI